MYNQALVTEARYFQENVGSEGCPRGQPGSVTVAVFNRAYYCLIHMVQSPALLNRTVILEKALFQLNLDRILQVKTARSVSDVQARS